MVGRLVKNGLIELQISFVDLLMFFSQLLEYEPRAPEHVPLLLRAKEDELALQKAIEIGDSKLSKISVLTKISFNPLSVNPTKWSNTLKQFVSCCNSFDHFVGLALKGLMENIWHSIRTSASYSISCHWYLSIPLENTRKPNVFR